jgi:hypothetical protein
MNPFLFIVGCPRSGTTLLQRILNAHPQIAITPESHWIPQLHEKAWALTPEGLVKPKLIRRLLAHPKFARLGISREELMGLAGNGQPTTYANLVSRIFDHYGRQRGKTLVGDKTPDYVQKIETLHVLWPLARFIHVIRDGRDVALSMMEWPKVRPKPGDFITWHEDRVSTAALWWELNVKMGRQARKRLGPELYYEVQYESLVCRPRQESAAVCEFLGVPYDDAMLNFWEADAGTDPGLEKKRAHQPVIPGLRDWRSQLLHEDSERFEAAAGTLLEELGYPRAVPNPSTEALEQATNYRELLAQDLYVHEVAGNRGSTGA